MTRSESEQVVDIFTPKRKMPIFTKQESELIHSETGGIGIEGF